MSPASSHLFGSCVLVGILVGVAGDGNQCVALTEVHQAHALGLSPGLAHLTCRGPDDAAIGGDRVQLGVFVDDQRSDQSATPSVVLDRQDALAAAALWGVLVDG